jgi:primosomal protein N' (replication factor Y) (superfamily II helicase)
MNFQDGDRVSVLTVEPLDRLLDYRAPEGGCSVGELVEVPLGPRKVLGLVWGPGDGTFDAAKLRAMFRVLEAPPMRAEMREFLSRVAAYTLTPMSSMLRLATRSPGLGDPVSMKTVYRLGHGEPKRQTDARLRVLDALQSYGGAALTLSELAEASGASPSVIEGLVKDGALREEASPRDLPYPRLNPEAKGRPLSPAQGEAASSLRDAVHQGGYSTTLLKGVTGSGKTEVYLEAVAECLAQDRQALVMLPEIALTEAFQERVAERFGARPGEWHSGITMTERRRLWKMAAEGEVQLVVGARSALFLPFQRLGLIVVDEEHDGSYKQEDGVHYSARDMAVLRGACEGAQVVLASATPSLETWVNAEQGRYRRLNLPARFGPAELPAMATIDMRDEGLPAGRWISETLARAVEARIDAKEQALLFLNRRGYAPLTICRACGHQVGCDHCDARMVEHRFLKRLVCHQCGATKPLPEVCPSCGVEGKMAPVGPGVERLAEEVTARFPNARLSVLSSDLFGSVRALKEEIVKIEKGAADIIIGTQLVAKGHNFPLLTLVGVIDADLGLQGGDLRAAEKTFQLMRQVAGRAGRADKAGEALLQTYQPDHAVIRAILSGDEEGFWAAEAAEREAAGTPPYGRLAGIVLSGPDAATVFEIGGWLARNDAALTRIKARVFGPAPAPIARIRGRHRVRLLVKADKTAPIQAALRDWVKPLKLPAQVRLTIDIDPQSFF